MSNLIVKRKVKSFFKKEEGISLVEVAIGLVVLGLIATPLIKAYKVESIRKSKASTRGSLEVSLNSINQYYSSGNGEYPCPASLILAEGNTDFGSSGDCTLSNIKLCTNILWKTSEGICKSDDSVDAVIIGGVPFATLLMRQENSLDYWGNKIIYAVTFEQTNQATFSANDGAIFMNAVDDPVAVQNGSADGVPDQKSDSIDFLLFSTGASGVGGFAKDGISTSICGNALSGLESENCNFDNRFFHDIDPSLIRASAFSLVSGKDFYDDIMLVQESVPKASWFQHPDNPSYSNNPPYTDEFIITLSTKIGIGKSPDTGLSPIIDVVGDIGTEAMLKSDTICDQVGNCFDPELITGTMSAMKCGSDQAVMKLANSKVSCSSAVDSGGNPIGNGEKIKIDTTVIKNNSCNPGDLVSGIEANGDITCVTP